MAHLGDFGTERAAVSDTFGYFGHTLRTNPELTDLAALEVFEAVRSADDRSSVLAALRNVVATLIHPDDADLCWSLAKANRQGIEEMGDLAARLLEAATDRPFEQPSDSSPSPPSTGMRSEDGSDLPALRVLDGRPDLQVAVVRAQKAG